MSDKCEYYEHGGLEKIPYSDRILPTDMMKKTEEGTLKGDPLPKLDIKPNKMGMKHTHRRTSRR